MCAICINYKDGKLTWEEAWQNNLETTGDHQEEVALLLIQNINEEDK